MSIAYKAATLDETSATCHHLGVFGAVFAMHIQRVVQGSVLIVVEQEGQKPNENPPNIRVPTEGQMMYALRKQHRTWITHGFILQATVVEKVLSQARGVWNGTASDRVDNPTTRGPVRLMLSRAELSRARVLFAQSAVFEPFAKAPEPDTSRCRISLSSSIDTVTACVALLCSRSNRQHGKCAQDKGHPRHNLRPGARF